MGQDSATPPKSGNSENKEERWVREAAYFDDEEYSEGLISDLTLQRYLHPRKPWLPAEYPFFLLQDVKGKRVLEVGCGDGGKAIVLALNGANVHGIDISPRAIEIARKRAALHGVSDRVTFICAPLETFVKDNHEPFDVICGWAVLHHLLPVLDSVLNDLSRLAKPDATFVFSEPVAMWNWVRELRLKVPIAVHGTPDERPLNSDDLTLLERHLPDLQARYFGAVLRILTRFAPGNYEKSSLLNRLIFDSVAQFDRLLLQGLGLTGLGSVATFYRVPKTRRTHFAQ